MSFLRNGNVTNLCHLMFPRTLLNLSNANAPCQSIILANIAVAKGDVALSSLRNSNVALSI